MKKIMLKSKNLSLVLSMMIVLGVASCKKYNSLGYTPGTGAPVITSVSTLSKVVNDTSITITTTYDNTGAITTKADTNTLHQTYYPQDSTTTQGNKQQYYVIHGNNLGSATAILFNGVSVYFNRAFGTDNSLIVNIPLTIPTVGAAATNKLSVVTTHGTANFNFTTLSPPPTIATISDYNFYAGSQITFTGVGFSTVSSVTLSGTTVAATIVSQSDGQIVLQFPSTTVAAGNLVFNYTSGGKSLTVVTTQLFENLDQSYQFFTDNYDNGWFSNSWGPTTISTTVFKTGTASFAATFPKGNYWADGFGSNTGIAQNSQYKYISFWIKGGIESYILYFTADSRGGFGNSDKSEPINVPAGVWTYVKIPLTTLNLWATSNTMTHFGLWIAGPADQDETFYLDDVVLLKQ